MLPRLKRTYDGVLRLVEMFRRVLILGIIAASDMSAFQTFAQVGPAIAHRETLLAARRAGRDFVDVVEVAANVWHDFLLGLQPIMSHLWRRTRPHLPSLRGGRIFVRCSIAARKWVLRREWLQPPRVDNWRSR